MKHVPSTTTAAKMDTPVGLHRGTCSCGWTSDSIGTVHDAIRDARQHAAAKSEPCPDCGVKAGQTHVPECDVARCLVTGGQRISCEENHHCGWQVWTGEWPGTAECLEYGFIAGALRDGTPLPDFNRLLTECRWDPTHRRWLRL